MLSTASFYHIKAYIVKFTNYLLVFADKGVYNIAVYGGIYLFGYVNIYKDDLKIRDYNMYRAVYCGVCESCGKNLSFFSRFALSYDITFLALVLSACDDEGYKIISKRCAAHPANKRAIVCDNRAVDYAACVGAMLTYLKFEDDFRDDKSPKALFAMLWMHRAARRARKRLPKLYEVIRQNLSCLSKLESENCQDADKAADTFAKILACCMTPDFVGEENRRQLYWLGYYTGRWIYLIDAVNDLKEDIERKRYNPYKSRFSSLADAAASLETSLTLTLQSAAAAYELLDIKRGRAVLDNILYKGLLFRQDSVLKGKDTNESL